MIRVSLGNGKSACIEVRSVALDSNPYLEMFALLETWTKGTYASGKDKKKFSNILNEN